MQKKADFDYFRVELLAGLAPAGGVESMLAERIVSLSWRLKRVERMSNEVIDVKIAKIETDSWEKEKRAKAGLVDPENGRSELILGWAAIKDFSDAQVLERLLMYERRIESSLYKAMNELRKLQRSRELEQAAAEVEPAPESCPSEDEEPKNEKQSQSAATLTVVKALDRKHYGEMSRLGGRENRPNQSQFRARACPSHPQSLRL